MRPSLAAYAPAEAIQPSASEARWRIRPPPCRFSLSHHRRHRIAVVERFWRGRSTARDGGRRGGQGRLFWPSPAKTVRPPREPMTLFNRYLLPGLIFMAVVIGGGYSTGRELIEFFAPSGPIGGVYGMIVTMIVWSAVLAISFELVRMTQSYDYRSFFIVLLGRAWFLFEIAYFALLILVLAVLGAAAGEVAHESFGWPTITGTLLLMTLIGFLVFFGSSVIEKVLALWAFLLYALYVAIIAWTFSQFGERIEYSFGT